MVSSEYAPLAKSGGLADAVSSLATALRREGADVRVVMPRYGFIPQAKLQPLPEPLGVPIGLREEWVGVYTHDQEVPVYLLDHQELFGRPGIYNESGLDYADNARRFSLLSYGAFQIARMLHWIPDIIHGHDWPTALAPVFLEGLERAEEFAGTASVLTIHNIGYQGIFASEQFVHTRLPWSEFSSLGLEFHGSMNLLRGGIVTAEILTTVSGRYAEEILTPEGSFGLHETLLPRRDRLYGVLNGIDTETWDPEEDPALPEPFSADDLAGKAAAKGEVQRRFGLEEAPRIPLIASIGRIAEQKGIRHLFADHGGAVERLCREEEIQMVLIGSGDQQYEERIRRLSMELPNYGIHIGYDEELSHLVTAGADFFLMPSQYEPCGLNQMYSMRYGTVPIVSSTGGLADTVVDEKGGKGATGFMIESVSELQIVQTVQRALEVYRERPERISQLQQAGMAQDFSWGRRARSYLELYDEALRLRSRR